VSNDLQLGRVLFSSGQNRIDMGNSEHLLKPSHPDLWTQHTFWPGLRYRLQTAMQNNGLGMQPEMAP
jgi:hypothetical protein